MYSPAKKLAPAEAREQVKERKRQQLAILLVNKFRNKFSVITTSEQEVDRLIINEVQSLLQGSGSAS